MKTTLYSILAAVACGMAFGQTAYTTPVGYETIALPSGVEYSLTSLRLHNTAIASGILTAVASGKVTDSQVNFTTLLTAGRTYVLEIKTGPGAGIIQEIAAWGTVSGNTVNDLVTTSNLSALGVVATNTYALRLAPTLEEIFAGPTVLNGFTGATADNVWIPNGLGGYVKYFRSSLTTPILNPWKNVAGGANTPNVPIIYQDGILIQKRAASPTSSIVVSGEVKKGSTVSPLLAGTAIAPSYNLLGTAFPAGSTLQNCGIKDTLLRGFTGATADNVWVPNGAGGYTKYFVSSLTTPILNPWKNVAGGANVVVDIPLTPGIIIERKTSAANVTLTPPPSYSTL